MPPEPAPVGRPSFAAWLRLAKPIAATLGSDAVLILDLGPSGAMLTGRCSVSPGTEHELAFAEEGSRVRVRCVVTAVEDHLRTPDADLLVRFVGRSDALEDFIAAYETQIHRAEVANAEGDFDRNVIDGNRNLADLGSAARSNPTYLQCRYASGEWTRELTTIADQPPDGFTISGSETEDQVALLQLAYEESGDHERRLLRDFAAASVLPKR
jgi:hypothetical protein